MTDITQIRNPIEDLRYYTKKYLPWIKQHQHQKSRVILNRFVQQMIFDAVLKSIKNKKRIKLRKSNGKLIKRKTRTKQWHEKFVLKCKLIKEMKP